MPDGLAAARSLGLDLSAAQGHPFRGIRFCDRDSTVEAAFPQRTRTRSAPHRAASVDGGPGDRRRRPPGLGRARFRHHSARASSPTTAWCAPAGSPAPMAATRPCAAGPDSMPATMRAAASDSAATTPWPRGASYMEIHWGDRCQLYITPVAADEVCVVLISRDHRLRLEDALPALSRSGAPPGSRRSVQSPARRSHRVAPPQSRVPRQCGAGGRCFRLRRRHHRRRPLPALPTIRGARRRARSRRSLALSGRAPRASAAAPSGWPT